MKGDKRSRVWWLVLALAGTLGLSLLAMYPQRLTRSVILRASGLWGLQCVFLSILSAAYLRRLVRFFGRSFVKIHHVLAVTGLACLCVHPLASAWSSGSLAVFVPNFDSWYMFWLLAGRPSFYLLLIAAAAAGLRSRLRDSWRAVHALNYAALILGSVHALLIGTDAQNLLPRVIIIAMCAVAAAVFVRKRWPALGKAA